MLGCGCGDASPVCTRVTSRKWSLLYSSPRLLRATFWKQKHYKCTKPPALSVSLAFSRAKRPRVLTSNCYEVIIAKGFVRNQESERENPGLKEFTDIWGSEKKGVMWVELQLQQRSQVFQPRQELVPTTSRGGRHAKHRRCQGKWQTGPESAKEHHRASWDAKDRDAGGGVSQESVPKGGKSVPIIHP